MRNCSHNLLSCCRGKQFIYRIGYVGFLSIGTDALDVPLQLYKILEIDGRLA